MSGQLVILTTDCAPGLVFRLPEFILASGWEGEVVSVLLVDPLWTSILFRFFDPLGFPMGLPVLYVHALPFRAQRPHVGRSPSQATLHRWH